MENILKQISYQQQKFTDMKYHKISILENNLEKLKRF